MAAGIADAVDADAVIVTVMADATVTVTVSALSAVSVRRARIAVNAWSARRATRRLPPLSTTRKAPQHLWQKAWQHWPPRKSKPMAHKAKAEAADGAVAVDVAAANAEIAASSKQARLTPRKHQPLTPMVTPLPLVNPATRANANTVIRTRRLCHARAWGRNRCR